MLYTAWLTAVTELHLPTVQQDTALSQLCKLTSPNQVSITHPVAIHCLRYLDWYRRKTPVTRSTNWQSSQVLRLCYHLSVNSDITLIMFVVSVWLLSVEQLICCHSDTSIHLPIYEYIHSLSGQYFHLIYVHCTTHTVQLIKYKLQCFVGYWNSSVYLSI